MNSETLKQFEEEIKQAINEALKTSNIGTVINKYGIPDNALTCEYTLDLSKLQLSEAEASPEKQGLLPGIQKPQIKLAQCTVVWCPDCIPGGTYICI
jgi:hypothetical protein